VAISARFPPGGFNINMKVNSPKQLSEKIIEQIEATDTDTIEAITEHNDGHRLIITPDINPTSEKLLFKIENKTPYSLKEVSQDLGDSTHFEFLLQSWCETLFNDIKDIAENSTYVSDYTSESESGHLNIKIDIPDLSSDRFCSPFSTRIMMAGTATNIELDDKLELDEIQSKLTGQWNLSRLHTQNSYTEVCLKPVNSDPFINP
jgi:hypothetical protein